MKTLLCYGDSNTWGSATDGRPGGRYAPHERWTGVLQSHLGAGWRVIEEGLPGRTTVHPDPIEGAWLDGSAYLMPCLMSHKPLDAVVVALGTNDLKARFAVPARDIVSGVAVLLAMIANAGAGPNEGRPKTLIVCPAPVLDERREREDFFEIFYGAHEKSLKLAPYYAALAEEFGAAFLDAGAIVRSSDYDGVHLDLDSHATLGRAIADAVVALRC